MNLVNVQASKSSKWKIMSLIKSLSLSYKVHATQELNYFPQGWLFKNKTTTHLLTSFHKKFKIFLDDDSSNPMGGSRLDELSLYYVNKKFCKLELYENFVIRFAFIFSCFFFSSHLILHWSLPILEMYSIMNQVIPSFI